MKVKVPEKIFKELPQAREDSRVVEELMELGLKFLKMEEALTAYKEGEISIWRAAKIAKVPLREMIRFSSAHGIRPKFDEKMIEEELA